MPTHKWIRIQERENKPKKNNGYIWRIPLFLLVLILGIIWFAFCFMILFIAAFVDGIWVQGTGIQSPSPSFDVATVGFVLASDLFRF